PSARTAPSVDSVSAERPHWRTDTSVSHSAPISSARCEIDLSPGTAMCPSSRATASTFIYDRGDEHVVALALEQLGGAACVVLAGDEQRQRAAAFGRDVLELPVLDVDPLRAERLGDSLEHARAVWDVQANVVERARVLVRDVEHAPSVLRRFADPPREEAGVALREGGLDLLDPPPVLGERLADRAGVVEEDVRPDARVRA